MKTLKLIWYWFKYFIIHSTGEYFVNSIIYEGLGYKKHRLYKYYLIFNTFKIVIFLQETNSLGNGNNNMERWLFDYHDKIILRRYYK